MDGMSASIECNYVNVNRRSCAFRPANASLGMGSSMDKHLSGKTACHLKTHLPASGGIGEAVVVLGGDAANRALRLSPAASIAIRPLRRVVLRHVTSRKARHSRPAYGGTNDHSTALPEVEPAPPGSERRHSIETCAHAGVLQSK